MQASFLQSDLPLHVALTKHKVSRTTRARVEAGSKLDSRGEVQAKHDEERGGCPATEEEEGDQEESSAHASLSGLDPLGKRGELVGTAEVDWR